MNHPKLMKGALAATAAVTTLGLYALKGRSNHPGMEALRGWAYAHRGLHKEGVPENSMAAFRAALEKGYGIELDIHLMADGNLAVIHDASLKRTAGADVQIEDLTAEDLENYRLEGTDEKIPLFKDVMALYEGKAPMIVELKPMNNNHDALAEAACELMKDYKGIYCMESFDPRCIAWLRKNRPQIIRGQLTENFVANDDKLHPAIRFLILWPTSLRTGRTASPLPCAGRPGISRVSAGPLRRRKTSIPPSTRAGCLSLKALNPK